MTGQAVKKTNIAKQQQLYHPRSLLDASSTWVLGDDKCQITPTRGDGIGRTDRDKKKTNRLVVGEISICGDFRW